MDDRPWFIDGLHADLFTVYQQFGLTPLHTQCQFMPCSIKQLFHTSERPEHLASMRAGVEEVQRACVALETKAHFVPAFGVADLPEIPGFLGCGFIYLECSNDRVVCRKSIWIYVTVHEKKDIKENPASSEADTMKGHCGKRGFVL